MTTKRRILRHSVGWFFYICYEVITIRVTTKHFPPLFESVIFYIFNIGFFYFHADILLKFSFSRFRNGYLVVACLILPEILIYFFLKYELDNILTSHPYSHFQHNHITSNYVFTNVWRGVLFVGLSTACYSIRSDLRLRQKNLLIETQQLKTLTRNLELENKVISIENAYLQSQISPHLLYNSLNFIYSSIYLMSETAGRGIMLLSELMRYSLVGAKETRTVLLAEEWREMEKLIELCRLRFGKEFFVSCRHSGKMAGIRIIPLVLITLVENMLKHGDVGEKKFPAKIRMEINDHEIFFNTFNKKRQTNLHPKGGLGLQNIEKRLANYYRDRFRLVIADKPDSFLVTLILQI